MPVRPLFCPQTDVRNARVLIRMNSTASKKLATLVIQDNKDDIRFARSLLRKLLPHTRKLLSVLTRLGGHVVSYLGGEFSKHFIFVGVWLCRKKNSLIQSVAQAEVKSDKEDEHPLKNGLLHSDVSL